MDQPGFPKAWANPEEVLSMQSPGDDAHWLVIRGGVIRLAIPSELSGSASISPDCRFSAGSLASFALTYTA